MIRIGLVDFDTSHVVAFTQRLNHVGVDAAHHVEGARVVVGCPGDSAIMPERIPGYVEQLRGYGVPLVERPEEMLGQIDAVMIESQQGSRHLERARPFLEAGLPTFVDKPFTATTAEADELIALARRHHAPLMSCSALRYDPTVKEALRRREDLGRILSADVWGSAARHEGNPGLLHYGIHGVEVLYTFLGPGCTEVLAVTAPPGDAAIGQWPNAQFGFLRGIREGSGGFGFTAHYERGHYTATVEGAAFYTEMLRTFVGMCETGVEPIDLTESREIMAFIEAVAESEQSGRAVSVSH